MVRPKLPSPASLSATDAGENGLPAGVGEHVWIDVIQKMDEVYNDLLQYEVALEEKNAALEDSQQFILSILTSMSDILVVCDRAGMIEDVNSSLVRLTGLTEDKLRGRRLVDLFADAESRRHASDIFSGTVDIESVHDCEVNIRAADGSAMAVSLNCTPRQSSLGKLLGVVITGRPVGELRRAYEALRHAHEELKRAQAQLLHSEKMASLGRLVAGVAHELNNPISFVLGNVHAMQRYAERLRRYLEAVHAGTPVAELARLRAELRIDRLIEDLDPLVEGTIEGAERTRAIVDGLKRFSVMDREENEVFNLVEVIERSVHWVTKSVADNFRVEFDLPGQIPVSGSAGRMQQVVMNLVQNAHDATLGRPNPLLRIRATTENGQAKVEFQDNGAGIAADDLPKVFEPFFTTKPIGKGTGLGLAISYGIVDQHGGQLGAANSPAGGALFTLLLPLAAARAD
jgi:two-component system, NtrC family, sensor histidine kinase HupT/HoxJ